MSVVDAELLGEAVMKIVEDENKASSQVQGAP